MVQYGKFLHTQNGRIIMSILLGFGLASLFRSICKGRNCIDFSGPPSDFMDKDKILNGTTYSKAKEELNDSSIFRSTMNTTNPTKSDNGVVITSTPKGDNGFDDKMWADLLK